MVLLTSDETSHGDLKKRFVRNYGKKQSILNIVFRMCRNYQKLAALF